MAEQLKTYTTRVSGFLRPRHTVLDENGKDLGVLEVQRSRLGLIVGATWKPEKGEVLEIKRDPGLLRAQFACWTEGREWLGSSIRPGVARRTIEMWTGGKPLRLVPRLEFGRGWRIVGAKSGVVAQIEHALLGRSAKIATFRKIDFELLIFAYFIGGLALWESALPTSVESVDRGTPATA
ncbi:hypothetical protein Poly30_19290 [Planctomycetes bacterium Poly30]|uniref:Scramblase n=1 Tax=Saltatorellus ferox TaxID=2528018 RepID=A0A518EQQ3_9BACT|nr:hypothetical protein Poly30_19290 [Planctomycetes bacterium Poly30]